ncbi:ankyrin [Annulohypoxylon moriforme]|nr:ankyrin [Annulohypoxylon moriforme]
MDVISAIASFIAIGQALAATPKIIDILKSVAEARQELLQLVNDVELLNSFGILIRETMDNLDNDSKDKFRIPQLTFLLVERVRADLASIVPQLEKLADKCQQQGGKGNGRMKLSRLKWLQHRNQIALLSERARKNCNDLQTVLSLSSFFALTSHGKMIIDIHTVVMNQAHVCGPQLSPLQPSSQSQYFGQLLSHAVNPGARYGISEGGAGKELEGSSQPDSQSAHGETSPYLLHTERAIQAPLAQFTATLPRSCNRGCRCKCHSSTSRIRSDPIVSPIYGWLKSAYNIIPRLGTRRCDVLTCRRAHSPVHVNFRFPLPLYSRTVVANLSYDSVVGVGASLHLRVARVIPWNRHIWEELMANKIDIVRRRLSRREISPFDIRSDDTLCLIEYATYFGGFEVLALLLQETTSILRGTDVAKRITRFARSELHFGRFSESHEIILQQIVALDEDMDDYHLPIHKAIEEGRDLPAVLSDSSDSINSINNCGLTPLHWAVRHNDARAIRQLISHGADPNISDMMRDTPLSRAIEYGYHDCSRALIDGGCDVNITRLNNASPFYDSIICEKDGSTKIANLLLENGATNFQDPIVGGSLLHSLAASPRAAEVEEKFQLLVGVGMKVEEKDIDGLSPLSTALQYNDIAMISLLMDAGCKFNEAPGANNALKLAAMLISAKIIDIIDEAELTMDVRWRDGNGNTALDVFEWRMDELLLPGAIQAPNDDGIEAFGRLLSGIRDRYLNTEIQTLKSIVTHLEEHNYILAREALKHIIEEKIKWNIPAEYRTFRAIDVQIKEQMIGAAIESLEEFMEVSRSHIGTDPFEIEYCNSWTLEEQGLVVEITN